MPEDFRTKAVLRVRGHLFEDFEVGQEFVHHWGRTITKSDTITFSTVLLHFSPIYFNREYAKAEGHPDIVVNPHLLFNVVLGLSVQDCSEMGGLFLGVQDLVYDRPVYPGTTVVAKSTTVDKRRSSKDPNNGIVTWLTEGFDGDNKRIVSFKRSKSGPFKKSRGESVMIKQSDLTEDDNYFEDFEVGAVIKHARGKTVTLLENVLITNLVMNSAQGHFNEHAMAAMPWGKVISYGGVNFSLVLGLSAQDCVENALEETGLNNIRLSKSVFHGDTIYAYTEILEKKDADRPDAGIVVFRHYGTNERDEQIAQVDRTALIKRRSHWKK